MFILLIEYGLVLRGDCIHCETCYFCFDPAFAWLSLKPVLNWTNVCSSEHTSDTSTNYDSFLNRTFSSPNMVRTVQTLLHSQLACNEMQCFVCLCLFQHGHCFLVGANKGYITTSNL